MRLILQQKGSIAAPRNQSELDLLVARRGELQGQLRAAEDRRFNLSQQVQATAEGGRAALNERMATLDQRIVQLERQLQGLDDAISTGLANPAIVGETHTAPPAPPHEPVPLLPPIPHTEGVVLVPPHFGPAIPINGRTLVAGGLITLTLLAFTGWLAFRYAVVRMSRLTGLNAGSAQATQLQQSLDAIAVEVERISENQRYVTKMLGQAPAEGVINTKPRDAEKVSGGR